MRSYHSLIVLLAGAALAACATTPPPVPPAALTYSGVDCAAAPDLVNPVSLTPDKERATFSVNAPITAATPCLLHAEGWTTPYVTFALPADYSDKTVIVGTLLEPLRILSPSVVILDREGRVSRTFGLDDYMYRGAVYSVQFRPRETEAYIVVTAEPSRVGRQYDSISVGVVTTTLYTGYGAANWNSGVEAAQSRTFSWEGTVQIQVADSDTEEDGE